MDKGSKVIQVFRRKRNLPEQIHVTALLGEPAFTLQQVRAIFDHNVSRFAHGISCMSHDHRALTTIRSAPPNNQRSCRLASVLGQGLSPALAYAFSNACQESTSSLSRSANDASSDSVSTRAASVNPARAKRRSERANPPPVRYVQSSTVMS